MQKLEFLITELPHEYGFEGMVCENDIILCQFKEYYLDKLIARAVRWHKANPKGRIAIQYRSGQVAEIA